MVPACSDTPTIWTAWYKGRRPCSTDKLMRQISPSIWNTCCRANDSSLPWIGVGIGVGIGIQSSSQWSTRMGLPEKNCTRAVIRSHFSCRRETSGLMLFTRVASSGRCAVSRPLFSAFSTAFFRPISLKVSAMRCRQIVASARCPSSSNFSAAVINDSGSELGVFRECFAWSLPTPPKLCR